MNAYVDKAALIAEEYKDFTHIVSHDLAAPLRHIREFTRLLIDARQEDPSADEKEYIKFLEISLRKLNEMQRALLDFSRINTQVTAPIETDCNEIAASVLSDSEEVINERLTTIECGDLPTIMADKKQIHSLFMNLISNALTFHHGNSLERKVAITVSDEGESYRFGIKDNGIGIAQVHHEQVFRLFRRLNNDSYPGIGAGLTIAKKIVDRHGGNIALDSALGDGTCVNFWLPK
ncbi:MAG: ATP-binding protein [Proteobacteria bacterium]|nr:ATP-binding protein [Pseudomonadota bacterium]